MRKATRFLVPATFMATVALLTVLFAPAGAIGSEPSRPTTVNGDAYLFGHDAVVDRPLAGSLQVYAGNASIAAPVTGDVLVFGGDVTIRGKGHVGGNVIYAGGNISGAEGRVTGRVYSLATLPGAAATLDKTAVIVSLLLAWLVVAIVVTLFSAREIRFSSVEVRASVLHCFALGLVAFTSFVLTAIVFSYLVPFVIGIPLLAALGVFAILTKVYGMVTVFHAVGSLVAAPRTREQLMARRWFRGDLAMVLIGVLILGALRLIPGIGTIIWGAASVFGVGVALATKFGRREPAFLAWREVEA